MEEIDLKELISMFWRKKLQIILLILIFATIGFIYTMGFVVPEYSSSTTLILASTGNNQTSTNGAITQTDISVNQKLVSTYSELVKRKVVLSEVKNNLGINIDEEELAKNISVKSVNDTEIIEIIVTSKNPKEAPKIANEIAKVFSEKVKEIYKIDNVQILDEAEINENPSNIHHAKDIIIFSFIGAVVAVMYVLVINMLDTTVKTQEEIEREFKIPVIAAIPIYEEQTTSRKKQRKGGRR